MILFFVFLVVGFAQHKANSVHLEWDWPNCPLSRIFYLLVLLLIIKNKDLWFPEFLPTELIVHRNSKPGLWGGMSYGHWIPQQTWIFNQKITRHTTWAVASFLQAYIFWIIFVKTHPHPPPSPGKVLRRQFQYGYWPNFKCRFVGPS